jgi:hypothetical protein
VGATGTQQQHLSKVSIRSGVVAHACNLTDQEAEAGESRVQAFLGQHSKTLSQNQKRKKKLGINNSHL